MRNKQFSSDFSHGTSHNRSMRVTSSEFIEKGLNFMFFSDLGDCSINNTYFFRREKGQKIQTKPANTLPTYSIQCSMWRLTFDNKTKQEQKTKTKQKNKPPKEFS